MTDICSNKVGEHDNQALIDWLDTFKKYVTGKQDDLFKFMVACSGDEDALTLNENVRGQLESLIDMVTSSYVSPRTLNKFVMDQQAFGYLIVDYLIQVADAYTESTNLSEIFEVKQEIMTLARTLNGMYPFESLKAFPSNRSPIAGVKMYASNMSDVYGYVTDVLGWEKDTDTGTEIKFPDVSFFGGGLVLVEQLDQEYPEEKTEVVIPVSKKDMGVIRGKAGNFTSDDVYCDYLQGVLYVHHYLLSVVICLKEHDS